MRTYTSGARVSVTARWPTRQIVSNQEFTAKYCLFRWGKTLTTHVKLLQRLHGKQHQQQVTYKYIIAIRPVQERLYANNAIFFYLVVCAAHEIVSRHLAESAAEPVNVDAVARSSTAENLQVENIWTLIVLGSEGGGQFTPWLSESSITKKMHLGS